ncbi:unnamed protein product [Phytophthora fragariaefolia]|uniref:Unnamed protein product n=1 Tax=Phytophthora fragariaefolia TaxID=1490495 RepID=A0A9W6YQM6_9STRA|nr:unnamed protein product [Phytophthora fragariaefolia]
MSARRHVDQEGHGHADGHDDHAGDAPEDHVAVAEARGQHAREEGRPDVDEVDDERSDARVRDAGVREDVARVVEHGVDTRELLRAGEQESAQELHAVLGRPDRLGLLRAGGVSGLGLIGLLVGLEPGQRSLHVLLAVQARDDLPGLLAAVLHEQPRGALHGQRRRQHHKDDGQHDGEAGHVAPSIAAVGEEEADRRHEDADGGRDLQTEAEVAAEVGRRQLVHVRADGAGGGTRRHAGDGAADGERPNIGDDGLDDGATDHEKAVEEQQLLAAHDVAEVAAEQTATHSAEDPRVHGEGPLELGVAAEERARARDDRTRIALVRVVVVGQVELRGGPSALEGLQQR